MDTWVVTVLAGGSATVGYILKKVADHLLGRGKIRFDEATALRQELGMAIERKDREIAALTRRVEDLEVELEKAERERDQKIISQERYKLDVYRTLVDHGANPALVDSVLAIQER